ncbi:MAG TPA: hypothetical protein VG842_04660 [Sediminibacterium sp.]|nr:hypothetical protein [Sediminibacterium sp.]
MNIISKRLWLCLLLLPVISIAQMPVTNPESADFMRSNGKIYVVVAIVLTILLGLFVFLISLDRKIRRMEQKAG